MRDSPVRVIGMLAPCCFSTSSCRVGRWSRSVLFLSCVCLRAQIPITGSGLGGNVNLFPSDLAILEAGEERKDLPCTATAVKPMLGFDLKFHAGYEVSVPLRELSGSENMLTIVFRIAPDNRKDQPMYF